jgi:hypothetical protein
MTQSLTEEKIEKLLQELQSGEAWRRKVAAETLGELEASNPQIAGALETVAANDSNRYVRQAAARALLTPAHQPFTHIRETPVVADSTAKPPFGSEERTARNWYWWLWLSPFLTIPTLIALGFSDSSYELVCAGNLRNCDYNLEFRVTILIAVLGSALWHLILLIPALSKESEFIRWHGRQALLLAGVWTAVPLAFGLGFGEEEETFWVIPVLIAVWLFGTLWGQNQAARGDCSLMRWFGRAEALPVHVKSLDPEALVDIIRYSRDPEERRKALSELEKLEMVESL